MSATITVNGKLISRLKSETHATIRRHAAEISQLSAALEQLDVAMRMTTVERWADEGRTLIAAARRLAALIEGCEVER